MKRIIPRPPKLTEQQRPPIVRVGEWLKKPDLFVTRREFWYLLKHYDTALQRERRENRWYRVLLRRLLAPIVGKKAEPDSSSAEAPVTPTAPGQTGA